MMTGLVKGHFRIYRKITVVFPPVHPDVALTTAAMRAQTEEAVLAWSEEDHVVDPLLLRATARIVILATGNARGHLRLLSDPLPLARVVRVAVWTVVLSAGPVPRSGAKAEVKTVAADRRGRHLQRDNRQRLRWTTSGARE